jgi:hypothetical protein
LEQLRRYWLVQGANTLYTVYTAAMLLIASTIPTLPSQEFYVEGQYPYAHYDNVSTGHPTPCIRTNGELVIGFLLLLISLRRTGQSIVCTRFVRSACGYQACARQLGRAPHSSIPSVSGRWNAEGTLYFPNP